MKAEPFVVSFDTIPWSQGGHPLEQKKLTADPHFALLRFEPGFRDPSVCHRGHFLYVLQGQLSFELEDGELVVPAGHGCRLPPGCSHRAQNKGVVPVDLLIVSESEALGMP